MNISNAQTMMVALGTAAAVGVGANFVADAARERDEAAPGGFPAYGATLGGAAVANLGLMALTTQMPRNTVGYALVGGAAMGALGGAFLSKHV